MRPSIRFHSSAPGAADNLAPVRLPFTVEFGAAERARQQASEPYESWGKRLGIWWDDAEEGARGVVVTGLLPQGAAARSGVLAVGDVITAVEYNAVAALGDLTRYLDRYGADPVKLEVVAAAGGGPHEVLLRVPGATPKDANAAQGSGSADAFVPTTDLLQSLTDHITIILGSPVQREVTHPGVAADPDFGCLGADLEFSLQNVGLSEMRNAIVRCEPRLKNVDVESVTLEVREAGEFHDRPGLRVTGALASTGQPVQIDLEIEGLRRARKGRSRRLDAGVEQA